MLMFVLKLCSSLQLVNKWLPATSMVCSCYQFLLSLALDIINNIYIYSICISSYVLHNAVPPIHAIAAEIAEIHDVSLGKIKKRLVEVCKLCHLIL